MASAASLAFKAAMVVLVNSVQPLLVDLARYHGVADPSCCLFVLPIFASMALVGFLSRKKGSQLSLSHWRKAAVLCSIDLAHQILEKAGLIYAGGALYLVASSFSTVWMALLSLTVLGRSLSLTQWAGVSLVTAGFCMRVSQLPLTGDTQEVLGVGLVTAAQILSGLTFVLNEKYMTDAKQEIQGPQLIFMCGTINTAGLLLWSAVWTVPNWEELVTKSRKRHGGSAAVVAWCFIGLTICSLLRSSVLWVLLKHLGAVYSSVLKAVRMAVVTLLAHIFFCERQTSQCLSPAKALAASVGMAGVLVYSLGSTAAAKRQTEQQTAKGRLLGPTEAEKLLISNFAQHADSRPLRV